ncbi:sce7726 family protein [Candidatus Parcubacteria bacterium]|nr:sce7726 family protein [Patescibacteria group bacterium]MCG2691047.1 sce7726 family protein [Candidatus Parcubacteria bacterium]
MSYPQTIIKMRPKKHLSSYCQHFILTNDKVIRVALKDYLKKSCSAIPNTKIIEELGITHGAARVDIAVVNGCIHGYELKSDKDTLNRLPGQIEIYNSVLDKITLVVGKSHLYEAIKIIPEWWGITIAKIINSDQTVSLCNIREPKQNPKPDYIAVAALLWREEALSILEELNKADGVRSKTRSIIYERLSKELTGQKLKERVRECLQARTNWRSGLQYIPCDG